MQEAAGSSSVVLANFSPLKPPFSASKAAAPLPIVFGLLTVQTPDCLFDRGAITAVKNLVKQVSLPSSDQLLAAITYFEPALTWPETESESKLC